MSLFSKVIISVSLGAIVIILMSGYFVYSFATKLIYTSVADYHQEVVLQKNSDIDEYFRKAKQEIGIFKDDKAFETIIQQQAKEEELYEKSKEHAQGSLQQAMAISDVWQEIYLVNKEKQIVLTSQPELINGNERDELEMQAIDKALSVNGSSVLAYEIDAQQHGVVEILLAAALFNDQDEEIGVIIGKLDWQQFKQVLYSINNDYHIRIVDGDGMILASNQSGHEGTIDHQWSAVGNKLSQQVTTLRTIRDLELLNQEQEFISFINNPAIPDTHFGWSLIFGAPIKSISAPTIKITAAISLIFILLMIVMVDITIFVLYRFVIEPVESITETARDITNGNLAKRITPKYHDEVGLLAEEFNAMTSKLEDVNRDLENKVRLRTQELAEKVEKIKYQNTQLEQARDSTNRVLVEVSEQKKNAEEAQKKMEVVIQEIYDGVMIVDTKGKITSLNKEGFRLLKHEVQDVLNHDILNVLQPESEKGRTHTRRTDPVWNALENGKATRDKLITFKKGSYHRFTARVSVSPLIMNKWVFGAVMIFRDVTRDLEIDRQKTEFISIASHQLRTPLSSIKWFVEMLLNGDTGKVNKQQADFLQEAAECNERMIKLVNDLLNVSRIEQERVAIQPQENDFLKLVKSVVREMRPLAKDKKTMIEIKAPKTLNKIMFDDELIRQVIQNLLSNAIKYTPDKGKVVITVKKQKDYIECSVQDNGYGVPDDQHENIFQKFFRAKNVLAREAEGNGLGLYLAKAVVESSGGRIWFESEQMKGSTFYFTLPTKKIIIKKGEIKLNS